MVQVELTHPAAGQGGDPAKDDRSHRSYIDPARAQFLLMLLDATAFFVGFMTLFYIALSFLSNDAAVIAAALLAIEAAYICVVAMRWTRVYDTHFLVKVVQGSLAAFGVTTVIGGGTLVIADAVLLNLPAGSWLGWLAAMTAYIIVSRLSAAMWAKPLANTGAFRQRIAIVGGGDDAAKVIDALEDSHDIDVEIIGMFDDRGDDRSPRVVRGYEKIGRLSDLENYANNNRVDLIVVAIPMTARSRLMQLLPKLWRMPVDIRICGQAIDMKLSPRAYTYLGRLPLLTVFSRKISKDSLMAKHIIDKVIATMILGILSPIILVSTLAVLLTSKGPLLTGEKRMGFDGKPFDLLRFRTRHLQEDGEATGELTLVGRFLEKTSLNETPELFNVLLGQLSIVGPVARERHAEGEVGLYEKAADGYCVRHGLRPGLVGWSQIHGFADQLETDEQVENRVKYDLEYVDRYTFFFDLHILVKTPFAWLRSSSPQYTV